MATVACQSCGRSRSTPRHVAKDGRVLCSSCRGKGRPRRGEAWLPPAQTRSASCVQCGKSFKPIQKTGGTFTTTCSLRCGMLRRYDVPPGSPGLGGHAQRYELERSRPGLTRPQRTRLLKSWVAAGLRCVYCGGLASTVDHIVPLHIGGSNYMDNLAPACLACDTSKGRKTLEEWGGRREHPMHGLRHPVSGEALIGDVLLGALQEAGAAQPHSSR